MQNEKEAKALQEFLQTLPERIPLASPDDFFKLENREYYERELLGNGKYEAVRRDIAEQEARPWEVEE